MKSPQEEEVLPLVETSSARKLLQIFSTEIACDGGAALVTSLKDYAAADTHKSSLTPKRLNALLVDSIQRPKVLAFLEAHPSIFCVDRAVTPHWVILKSAKYVDWLSLTPDQPQGDAAPNNNHCAKLADKILYTLRHRSAKMERRRRRQQNEASLADNNILNELPTNSSRDDHISKTSCAGVNISWLLSQCCWEVHDYLRTTGLYLQRIYPNNNGPACSDNTSSEEKAIAGHDHQICIINSIQQLVQPVGSRAWKNLVLEEFTNILVQMNQTGLECLVVDAERIKITYLPQPAHTPHSDTTNSPDNTLPYLQSLDATLTELVDQDGATQVRLEVLLHRYEELRRLLGGRDLWDIVQRSKSSNTDKIGGDLFDKIDIFKDGHDIILQTKNKDRQGRMKVDSEGHFSVTNGKWGMAMANIMVRCCEKVGWTTKSKNVDSESEKITAIDLTASVGGMTLGLAKTRFFRTIIGIEIDRYRAELCRQNMTELTSGEYHADAVDIRTMDAMDAIPTLPSRSCLVIDPPWGGENYKKKNAVIPFEQQQQLRMGPWTLDDILCEIYNSLRPCLVGLRLPVTFVVDDFMERLRLRLGGPKNGDNSDKPNSVFIETLAIRKLSVQLFLVLYFSNGEDENKQIPPR